MMLFLGAGASKPFGIKTMEEMSEEFENRADEILRDDKRELYLDIKNTLGSNLEDILTVLNDLINNTVSVEYTTSYIKKLFDLAHPESLTDLLGGDSEFHNNLREIYENLSLIEKEKLEALKSKILTFIRENCALKEEEEKLRDIIRVCDQLFEILKYNSSTIFDIFTTNYDLVIEKYYDLLTQEYYFNKKYDYVETLRRISYTDGFFSIAFTASGSRGFADDYVWNPKEYDEIIKYANNKDIPTIRLFKLHGSIDQYIEGNEIVKRDILYSTPTTSGEERLESMIYPMREKEVYKDPFFELFTRLKTSLADKETKVCIVIGYSFGDEHIRNIFFDAVKRNAKIGIILVNPNAKKIRDDLQPIKDMIEPIEGEFGEESVFEELEEKLKELEGV